MFCEDIYVATLGSNSIYDNVVVTHIYVYQRASRNFYVGEYARNNVIYLMKK